MSLSKFYKSTNAFQAKSVLEKSDTSTPEPVWESIVKEELPATELPEESVPDEPMDISEPDTAEIGIDPSDEIIPDIEADQSSPGFEEEIEAEEEKDRAPEPVIDVETIRENAFTSGITAGRQQAEEDFENSAQTLLSICNELDRLRETILQNSVGEMKEMVLAISEIIIRHSVTEQEDTIVATIKDSIQLAVKSDEFMIRINPLDLEAVESRKKELISSMSGLVNIVLKPDSTIERGGCALESTSCTVDASMASQLKVIYDSIMAQDIIAGPNKTEESH